MNIFTELKYLRMVKISKTYIPKETEKYMCAKHLAFFKKKLLDWKTDLKRSSNEALFNSSLDDNSTSADIVDQASSYTEKNVEMRAINRQIKLITKIDSALKKIQDGTYGFCEDTGEPIGLKRLMARPVATGLAINLFKPIGSPVSSQKPYVPS